MSDTVNDAARRAVAKLDEHRLIITQADRLDVTNIIAAEFAGFVKPEPVPDAELDRLEGLLKPYSPPKWTFWPGYGISPEPGVSFCFDGLDDDDESVPPEYELVIVAVNALPRLLASARESRTLADENARLRGMLKECRDDKEVGWKNIDLRRRVDAALKGASNG